jgi:hypothetical protein
MRTNKTLLPAFVLALTVLGICGRADALDVGGLIATNTTWGIASSPIVMISDVTVQAGVTLTIEPGVVVMANSGIDLVINGGLVAVGTVALPISFQANGSTTPGAWPGIDFATGSTSTLSYVELHHAATALDFLAPVAANHVISQILIDTFSGRGVETTGASSTLSLSFMEIDGAGSASSYGIYSDYTDLTITDSWIYDTNYGIYELRGDVTAERTIFSDNVRGVYFYTALAGTFWATFSHCTFWNNTYSVYTYDASSSGTYISRVDVDLCVFGENNYAVYDSNYLDSLYFTDNVWWGGTAISGVTASPNTGNLNYNGLLVDPTNGNFEPTDRSPARYPDPAVPASTMGAVPHAGALTGAGAHGFWYVNTTFAASSVNNLDGDMVIAPDVTVTFLPGAQFLVAANSDIMEGGENANLTEIRVEGTLESDGTVTIPIIFTSAAGTPAPGDWYGIVIPSTAQAFNVSQVNLGYAYRGVSLYSNDHKIAGSTIHHCSSSAVYVTGGTPEIISIDAHDNSYGIYVSGGASVDITDTNVWNSVNDGVYIYDSSVNYDHGILYDNGRDGLNCRMSSGVSRVWTIDHVTSANNVQDGIELYKSTSTGVVTVALTNTSVTHNGAYGVKETSVNTSFSCGGSNSWGNSSTNYYSLTAGTTCYQWNPLYANITMRNYEPTTHSPNRKLGQSGTYIGALDYAGASSPHIEGFLWDGYAFTAAASPYPVLGDLIIPDGATVTFEAGVDLEIAAGADEMGGGQVSSQTEIYFRDGAIVTFTTT